jgi:exopolyphosphatase/guanosine-5'-triphosphate,3'-diphosphate pyrophosphatase
LIGETDGKTVAPYLYQRRITRLAGGFTNKEGLSHQARERTLSAFQEFATICRQEGVTTCRAVGTAAYRKAVNGQKFADEIKEICAINLKIIDGEEEASLMASGVLSALVSVPETSLIIDIGGGSTEFVLCVNGKVLWQTSLSLGVVLLTERVAPESRAMHIEESLDQLLFDLEKHLSDVQKAQSDIRLIGTAGTVTTLAALDMHMDEYDWRRVNNYSIGLSRIEYWQSVLQPLSPAERETLPGMEEGRGDLIMAGIQIILALMKKLDSSTLKVSDFGILEGLLLSLTNNRKT